MSYVNKNGSERTGVFESRWHHSFSQSFITTFMACPEQARAEYFREVESEYTDSTALGTAVHAGIEYALDAEIHDAYVPDLGECVDVAHHELDLIGSWKYTKMSKDMVYIKAHEMIHAWFNVFQPVVLPIAVERGFRVPSFYEDEHRTIDLVGTIDCVAEDGVWDWKTASRPYEQWEKQRWAVQPTVYLEAVIHEYLFDTSFHYGIMLHDGTTQKLTVRRDEGHVEWLRQVCTQIAWMIEHEIKPWPMNDHGWHCHPKWCGNWANCKGKYMLDGWEKA